MGLNFAWARLNPYLLHQDSIISNSKKHARLVGQISKQNLGSFYDEDIPAIDATATTAPPILQGPITRARARELNYQVLSFLGTVTHIHEHMILPKSDVFMLLRNNGPSMDKKDNQWSMIMHREGSKLVRIEDDATSEDFSTLKQIGRAACRERVYVLL